MTDKSIIENCRGGTAAALYATGSSSVYISGDTIFRNSWSDSGSVLYFSMTDIVDIEKTSFIDNMQQDIFVEKANLIVKDSSFVGGAQQSIIAYDATNVTLINSNFINGVN